MRGALAACVVVVAVVIGGTGLAQIAAVGAGGWSPLGTSGQPGVAADPDGTAAAGAGGTESAARAGTPGAGVPGAGTPGSPGIGAGETASGSGTTGPDGTSPGPGAPGPSTGPGRGDGPGSPAALACWGDSLTYGSGGDGTTYPDVLAALSGLPVFNGGVPGERSAGIAAREGGAPAATTVVGGSVPATGGVEVTFDDDVVIIRDAGTLAGTLMNVHGVLSRDRTGYVGTYTFTRDVAGEAVQVPSGSPFITDISETYQDAGVIIWAGHNDIRLGGGQQVIDNIATMVEHVDDTGRYLVLGLSNGTGAERGTDFYREAVGTVNPALQAAYGPDHYLDVRRWLIEDGMAAAGLELTAQDERDIVNDIPPSSLRNVNTAGHLNATGYRVLAQYIYEYISAQGWLA